MIFYCICDGVNTAARVWFVFQVMGALFEPRWIKWKMRIGWGGGGDIYCFGSAW